MVKKVAFITGGASGIGLAVAQSLASGSQSDEDWDVHLVDLNADALRRATSLVKNAHSHQTDVTDYTSLASAFESAWSLSGGRLDFVFANAGIIERDNFYEEDALDAPPSPLDTLVVDINYKAVISTSRLALHYFRKSLAKHSKSDPVLIMTASCGGLYPAEFYPMYSGSKAAVIHFHRAITVAYHHDGVRTFAICPGTVQTGLKSPEEWKLVPENFFTPIEIVVDTVINKLVDGGDIEDSKGRNVQAKENWG